MASWLLSLLPLLQVRHFYYRTWHKISKYLRLAPDAEGVRAHKELHGLINYGEMWKKLGGYFNDRCGEKLNELVRPLPFFFLFANNKKKPQQTPTVWLNSSRKMERKSKKNTKDTRSIRQMPSLFAVALIRFGVSIFFLLNRTYPPVWSKFHQGLPSFT